MAQQQDAQDKIQRLKMLSEVQEKIALAPPADQARILQGLMEEEEMLPPKKETPLLLLKQEIVETQNALFVHKLNISGQNFMGGICAVATVSLAFTPAFPISLIGFAMFMSFLKMTLDEKKDARRCADKLQALNDALKSPPPPETLALPPPPQMSALLRLIDTKIEFNNQIKQENINAESKKDTSVQKRPHSP